MPKQTEHHFPEDHPTAAGHFPGNPVIPGAVLLDTVIDAILAKDGGAKDGGAEDGGAEDGGAEDGGAGARGAEADGPCRVRSAKFLYPVRPGDRMVIAWQTLPSKEAKFTCTVNDRPVLNGSLAR